MALLIGLTLVAVGVFLGLRHVAETQKSFHMKPRLGFAQVTVVGNTENSEQMSLTATLFNDESPEEWKKKMEVIFKLREERLHFQNQRMLELQAESIRLANEAKEAGSNVTPIKG